MADDTRAARQELQNRIASLQQQINTNGASGDINREGSQAWLTNVQLQSDLAAAKAGLNAYVSTSSSNIPVYTEGQVNQSADTGTNAPVRTLQETQGIFAEPVVQNSFSDAYARYKAGVPSGTVYTTTSLNQARTIQSPGVGSSNDDRIGGNSPGVIANQTVNQSFNTPIIQQPNVLDQYASYTYNIGWYLLTKDQWNALPSGVINTNKWTLIMQSGGAQAGAVESGQGGRSKYFPVDYYMDNLVLTTNMPTGGIGGTMGANFNASLEFTVTEPNGVTLANNLAMAVKDLYRDQTVDGNQPWLKVPQCLIIRFYGYDDNGNLVQAGKSNNQNGSMAPGPSNAVVTKCIPFFLSAFKWKLASRQVEYHITGTCAVYDLLASSRRGSVPAQFELVGKTTGDILAGDGQGGRQVTTGGDDGRTSTPTVSTPVKVKDLPMNQQAAIAAGTDPNAVNPQGMAFGGGGL